MMTILVRLTEALVALLFGAGLAFADEACRDMSFETGRYAVCEAGTGEDLRLYLTDEAGATIGTFERLRSLVAARGDAVVFAMNAGMFHPDRRPVGLYIEDGVGAAPLITRAGPGNFGLTPNGVFCIAPDRFAIYETGRYDSARPECRFATQSGPMLVIGGKLHPRFLPQSDSRYIRNGVGVSADGERAYFVISAQPVNFDTFARFFRDALGVPDALYFDGNVSRLFAPELGRADFGFPMGPMVALTRPR